MWYYESKKKKKFDPVIQKTIIYTLVDFINSIMEQYAKMKKNKLYSVIFLKFFKKLQIVYSDNNIINKLRETQKKKIIIIDGKKKYISSLIESLKITKKYAEGTYNGVYFVRDTIKYIIKFYPYPQQLYYNVSNITNLSSGVFHDWVVKGCKSGKLPEFCYSQEKTLECTICSQEKILQKYNVKDTKLIREKYRKIRLREITKKYCKSGDLHQFVYDMDLKCDICINCKHIDSDKLKDAQLSEIYKNIVMAKQI